MFGSDVLLAMGLSFVLTYLLGSLNFAVIVSRLLYHDDVRNYGSGNAGMTNMLRTYGKKAAFLTGLGDFFKGTASVLIARTIIGSLGVELPFDGGWVGAIGVLLGHLFPIFFHFKGGKGIATSFGCLLIVFPVQTLCAFGVFLLIVALTRYVSAGSLGAAVTLPFFIMLTTPCNPVIWGSVIAICLLAIWRHAPNIKRLMNHTESKISLSKKK